MIEIIRLDQRSANISLIQIRKKFFKFDKHSNEISHRTAWSLYLKEQSKRSVIELREVSISRSKLSVSLLQWHRQCNDLLIALSISELIRLSVHVQLVSLLQWHLFSMQWSIFSSFYSSVNLIIHSHATSESATMTSFVNAMIYLLTSLYLSVNQSVNSFACN